MNSRAFLTPLVLALSLVLSGWAPPAMAQKSTAVSGWSAQPYFSQRRIPGLYSPRSARRLWMDSYAKEVAKEREQYLPGRITPIPNYAPDVIARYQELDRQAAEKLEAGELAKAEAILRQQLSLASTNPELYLRLASIASQLDNEEAALRWFRQAVVRGFLDFKRVRKDAAFAALRKLKQYQSLERAVPRLVMIQYEWDNWGRFEAKRCPDGVEGVQRELTAFRQRFQEMRPVLGHAQTGLWMHWLDFAAAALLERYVSDKPEAADLEDALELLMTLYTQGGQFRWRTLPVDQVDGITRVSETILERYPDSPLRAEAMVARALVRYSDEHRGRRGKLGDRAIKAIRSDLELVLVRYPDSVSRFDAYMGLIRLAEERHHYDEARRFYDQLMDEYKEDPEVEDRVRGTLGALAIRLEGLPPFEATTLAGTELSPEAMRGKLVLLDFWATWCVPCRKELDTLRKIHKKYAPRGLEIVGVSLDREEDMPADKLKRWLEKEGVPWEQVYDGKGWASDLARQFSVSGIPFTVLVGPDGAVLGTELRGSKLEKAVKVAIKKLPARED